MKTRQPITIFLLALCCNCQVMNGESGDEMKERVRLDEWNEKSVKENH